MQTPDRRDITSSFEWSFWHEPSSISRSASTPYHSGVTHVIFFKLRAKTIAVLMFTSPIRKEDPSGLSQTITREALSMPQGGVQCGNADELHQHLLCECIGNYLGPEYDWHCPVMVRQCGGQWLAGCEYYVKGLGCDALEDCVV